MPGVYEWQSNSGYKEPIAYGLFPLLVNGVIRQCLAVEDYTGMSPDTQFNTMSALVLPTA